MEFGRYAGTQADPALPGSAFVPGDATVMINGNTRPWPGSAVFDAIGARPDGAVRFGYGVAAGTPAQASGFIGASTDYAVPTAMLDFYFIAQAVTDLDGDGTAVTIELTSFTRTLWNSQEEEGSTGTGWE
jgi:hypothetical protein